MTLSPLVSVVMPSYNYAPYLPEAIRSVLTQTYENLELLVVDDGSSDESPAIIRRFAAQDARVKAYWLDHGGAPRTGNVGVRQAQGRYIAHLDCDDVALPDRLAVQVARMQRDDLDVCGAQAEMFGAQSGPLWFPESHEGIGRELLFRVGMMHSTLMFRAEVLRKELYDERVVFDDYELLTRFHPRYRLGNLTQLLVRHRRHQHNVSMVFAPRLKKDMALFRFRFFYESFPDTPIQEYLPLAALADRRTFTDASDLERAARWLVRLADSPDLALRRYMARRWEAAHGAAGQAGMKDAPSFEAYRDAILGVAGRTHW